MAEKQKRDARDGDGDGFVQDGTKFERPEGFVIGAKDGDGDGLVQDGTEWERPVEEADIVPENPAASTKSKKSEQKKSAAKVPTIIPADTRVELSKLIFESLYERNSRSVGLTQIRLIELGYMSAGADKRGWLSTGTKEALEAFALDREIEGDYKGEETITAVFADTPVEIVP
jgi:hypothetical protein